MVIQISLSVHIAACAIVEFKRDTVSIKANVIHSGDQQYLSKVNNGTNMSVVPDQQVCAWCMTYIVDPSTLVEERCFAMQLSRTLDLKDRHGRDVKRVLLLHSLVNLMSRMEQTGCNAPPNLPHARLQISDI
jgi:threonine dehydratase